jgi:hypothetical protein
MIQPHTVRDGVRYRTSVARLRDPAFRIANRMQDIDPADQFSALLLAAVVASQALGLDPHEELERARRMVADAEGPFTIQVQALRDYVRGELLNR